MIRPVAVAALLAAAPLAAPIAASAQQDQAQQQGQDQQAQVSADAARPDAPRPLPLDEQTRQASVDALQQTLFDLQSLRLASHQAHWNVVGEEFYQLHEFYEGLYTDIIPYIDDVAERMRALGAPVDGRPSSIAENAPLEFREPAEGDLGATVPALLDGWGAVQSALYERIDATSDDLATQDLLIGVARLIDIQAWQLGAHLN